MTTFSLSALRALSFILPTFAARKAAKLFMTPVRHQRPEVEKAWLASARIKTLKSGLVTYEWGDPSHPIVMMVHGWEGRGTQMGAFVQPLLNQGFFVVALDAPAHGDSPGAILNAGVYSRAMLSAQQEIGQLKAVIGHSFGAGCSVMAANMGMKVERLVHIAGPSDYLKVIRHFLDFVKLSSYCEKKFFKEVMKSSGLTIDQIHIGRLGEAIESQIFIIHDQKDKDVKLENAYELHQAWPSSKLLVTDGLGHRRILKDPAVIEAIVNFILND